MVLPLVPVIGMKAVGAVRAAGVAAAESAAEARLVKATGLGTSKGKALLASLAKQQVAEQSGVLERQAESRLSRQIRLGRFGQRPESKHDTLVARHQENPRYFVNKLVLVEFRAPKKAREYLWVKVLTAGPIMTGFLKTRPALLDETVGAVMTFRPKQIIDVKDAKRGRRR